MGEKTFWAGVLDLSRGGQRLAEAADLRKQLMIPQETVSNGLRVVVVRGSESCLCTRADGAM